MKVRKTQQHNIEGKSKNIIRTIIEKKDQGIFREVSGRDYGIDAIVEYFDNGQITGKIALIQCKGTGEKIEPLKTFPNFVSCKGISASNLEYALQDNSLIILTYASVVDNKFYFVQLNDLITNEMKEKLDEGQERFNIRIPINNNSDEAMERFWNLVKKYY